MTSLITKFDRLALLLIVVLGVVLFLVWARFPEYKSFGQGDPYLDANQYLPGKNFAERGFFHENFLAEYATGPEECYPLWYTHNPSLSEIMSGLYYRAGLQEISQQRTIAILWNLLGAWFFYLLLKRLAGPLTALISLAVFISNPLYIAWGDNLFTNHQWCFAFAGMYFFLRAVDPASGLKTPPTAEGLGSRKAGLYLGLAALCFFLLCYSNYEYVPFVAIFFIGVKVFKIREVPWSRIILLLGTGLAAVIIHQFWVIRAIGFDYWLIDKTESLFHRTGLGVTSLMEIYRRAPILMWEEQASLRGSYTLSGYWKEFYLHLEDLFGYGWSVIFLVICIFGRRLLPGSVSDRKKLFRTIILFFIMSVFWFLAFVQHTADHRWGSTILLFAPFAALLYGVTLDGLYRNLIRRKTAENDDLQNKRPILRITGIVLTLLLLSGLIVGRVRTYRPFEAYPGIKALTGYRGKNFLTSSIPTLVSACTGTPTGWSAGKHPARIFSHSRYLVNPNCELLFQPDYFFSPRHPEDPEFSRVFDDWLSANFAIEEEGDNFTIYNLNDPLKSSDSAILSLRGLRYLRRRWPRAVWARLDNEPEDRRYPPPPPGKMEEPGLAEAIAEKLLELTGRSSLKKAAANQGPILVRATGDNLFTPASKNYVSSAMKTEHPSENLYSSNPDNYWHISEDRLGEPAWVAIDFGADRREIINFIRTKPRPDIPEQSFKTAIIQGSHRRKNWENIATIIEEEPPASRNWKGWYFPNNTPYRFYRFFILDGLEANGAFYSLGALELYHVKEYTRQEN